MESCRRRWPQATKLILCVFCVSLSIHVLLLQLQFSEVKDDVLNHGAEHRDEQRVKRSHRYHAEEYRGQVIGSSSENSPDVAEGHAQKAYKPSRQLSAVEEKGSNDAVITIPRGNFSGGDKRSPPLFEIRTFLLSRSRNINNFNYRYMINEPYRCLDEESMVDPFLIVIIPSHPLYKIRRDAIRDTWGTISRQYGGPRPVRTLFVIGRDEEENTNLQILHESKMYRDIIQLDIADAYSNLTLKTILGLQWVVHHCSAASFVLKSDDDTMVNMSGLLRILQNIPRHHLLLGSVNLDAEVMRIGRWGLTYEQYPFDVFPPYLNGAAYVMSIDTVKTLFYSAKTTELLPLEDVHLTGVVPLLTGTNLTHNDAFAYWSTRVTSPCEMVKRKLITAHGVQPEMIYDIWKFTTRLHKCSDNKT